MGGGTETGTGYYIDSAVSGVDYVCGSKSGKTGADGSFTFEKGKSCTFSLGSMKLREVKADKLKDQIKVLEDNLVVATLLQTLDSDGNPDNNGIVISAKVLAELKAKNITTLPANQNEVAEIYEVIKNVDGYQGKLKSETEAQTHLVKELLAGKTFYAYNEGEGIDKISFNATATAVTWPGDSESISINGNKIVSPDGSYKVLISHSSEYIGLTDYFADGTAKGGISRLYYDKVKAEAYLDSLGGSSDTPDATKQDNQLKDLLAGKTFWEVDNQGISGVFLNKVDFNSEFDKITIISDIDSNDEKTETMRISYEDGKIKFLDSGIYKKLDTKTEDYIELTGGPKLYFERTKAEADLNVQKAKG